MRLDELQREANAVLARVGIVTPSEAGLDVDRSAALVVINRRDRMRRAEIDHALVNILLSMGATWET